MSLSNSKTQTHKTCATCTRAIFSYGDLICADIDLDPNLALVSYLHGMYVIVHYGCPILVKSFKIIVEPGFSHEFGHAEFNGAKKSRIQKYLGVAILN